MTVTARADGKVLRLDFAPLRRARVTPQGFLRIDASLGRTGVFTYDTPDGPRRELRLPEEVFRADSIATAAGAVVTDMHPPREQALITPANWRKWAIGFVGDDVRQDGQHLAGSLVIQDEQAIGLVNKGERREISPGYVCSLEPKSGRWDGQPYDCIQRDITYNSIGIGPRGWGRQGSEVALRLDSLEPTAAVLHHESTALGDFVRGKMLEKQLTQIELADAEAILDGWMLRPSDEQLRALGNELGVEFDELIELIPAELRHDSKRKSTGAASSGSASSQKERTMDETELRLDGLTIKLDKRDAELVRKAVDERDAKIKQLTSDQSALQARFDGLTEQQGKLKKELDELPNKLRDEMKVRAALESEARRVLGSDVKLDGKSDRQVRQDVLAKLSPELKLDGKDDTYVTVRFDVAMEDFKEPSAGDKVRQAITGGSDPKVRMDEKDAPDPAAARAKMIEENLNAWKRPSN